MFFSIQKINELIECHQSRQLVTELRLHIDVLVIHVRRSVGIDTHSCLQIDDADNDVTTMRLLSRVAVCARSCKKLNLHLRNPNQIDLEIVVVGFVSRTRTARTDGARLSRARREARTNEIFAENHALKNPTFPFLKPTR